MEGEWRGRVALSGRDWQIPTLRLYVGFSRSNSVFIILPRHASLDVLLFCHYSSDGGVGGPITGGEQCRQGSEWTGRSGGELPLGYPHACWGDCSLWHSSRGSYCPDDCLGELGSWTLGALAWLCQWRRSPWIGRGFCRTCRYHGKSFISWRYHEQP